MKTKTYNNKGNKSIKKKLSLNIVAFVSLLVFVFLTILLFIVVVDISRVFITAEVYYTNHLSRAVSSFDKYANTKNEVYFHEFENHLHPLLILSDTAANMRSDNHTFNRARAVGDWVEFGFHPNDAEVMVFAFRSLRNLYFINRSLEIIDVVNNASMEVSTAANDIYEGFLGGRAEEDMYELFARIDKNVDTIEEYKRIFEYMIRDNVRYYMQFILYTLVFLIFIGLVVFTANYWIIVKNVISQVRNMQIGALRMAKGDFSKKVEVKNDDELGKLTTVFNDMMDQVAESQKIVEADRERAIEDKAHVEDKNIDLERFNKIAVNRELKMIELKNRVAELEGENKDLKKGGSS